MIFGESIIRLYTYNLPSDYLVDMRCKTFYWLSFVFLNKKFIFRSFEQNYWPESIYAYRHTYVYWTKKNAWFPCLYMCRSDY